MRQRTIFAFGLLGFCAGCDQRPDAGLPPADLPADLPDGSASCTDYSGSYLFGAPVEPACAASGSTPTSVILTQTGCAASFGTCNGQVSGTVLSCSLTSGGITVDLTLTFSGGAGSGGTYVVTCTGSACPWATCTGTFTRQ